MLDLSASRIISDLSLTQKTNYQFTLETSYGLSVQINRDAIQRTTVITSFKQSTTLNSDIKPQTSDASRENRSTTDSQPSSYKYRLFPDWGTGFLWYDTEWPGTPEGENLVMEDEILARYGSAFSEAYEEWVARYTKAFREQRCDCGSGEHPFPDVAERKAWVLDGMMLAAWLCHQSDVESVEYSPDDATVLFEEKKGLGATLGRFLKEIDKYLT